MVCGKWRKKKKKNYKNCSHILVVVYCMLLPHLYNSTSYFISMTMAMMMMKTFKQPAFISTLSVSNSNKYNNNNNISSSIETKLLLKPVKLNLNIFGCNKLPAADFSHIFVNTTHCCCCCCIWCCCCWYRCCCCYLDIAF